MFTRLWLTAAPAPTAARSRAGSRSPSSGKKKSAATSWTRRRGAERRSHARSPRPPIAVPNAERPVEHVRNALQLLREVALVGDCRRGRARTLARPSTALHRAVALLERQKRDYFLKQRQILAVPSASRLSTAINRSDAELMQ